LTGHASTLSPVATSVVEAMSRSMSSNRVVYVLKSAEPSPSTSIWTSISVPPARCAQSEWVATPKFSTPSATPAVAASELAPT